MAADSLAFRSVSSIVWYHSTSPHLDALQGEREGEEEERKRKEEGRGLHPPPLALLILNK